MQKWALSILYNSSSIDSIIEGLKGKLGEDKLNKLLTDLIKGENVYLTVGGNYLSPQERKVRTQKEVDELKETMKTILFERKPQPDYIKMNLQWYFIENEKFQPVREFIDKKFTVFLKKLISLSPYKKELRDNKQELLKVFYNIIYQRVINDSFLSTGVGFINDARKKIEKGDNSIIQRLIVDAGLEHFKPIIDEVFEIPSLVLTTFESSTSNYEKELKKYGKLDTSDPNEQKLFKDVWKINDDCNTKNIKFSPCTTFKKINDKKNYIDIKLIQPYKFSTTPLYNRYKQFRKRQQKKNKNGIRLPN